MNIYISTANILLSLFSLGSLSLFGVWLFKEWVGVRIDKSIQHHYDKDLEDYKVSRIRRQKAEGIAKLFSVWIKYRGKETELLDKNALIERYEELNRMSLELSLWIEDVQLLNDIMNRLQNVENAKTIRDLMGEVRKLILEKKDDFDSKNIVLWPPDSDAENLFGNKK